VITSHSIGVIVVVHTSAILGHGNCIETTVGVLHLGYNRRGTGEYPCRGTNLEGDSSRVTNIVESRLNHLRSECDTPRISHVSKAKLNGPCVGLI
jgi:hypothetical protein